MARFVGFLVVAALGGCSFSGKLNGTGISGPSGGGGAGTTPTPSPSGNGLLVVPDLTGKTATQADATLRAAGFTFDRLEISDRLCNVPADETQMVPQDTVCDQRPAAGAENGPRLIAPMLTIEHDTYEHGGAGGPSEWRRMPDLVGKPLDVARTLLARANLPVADEFEIVEYSGADCQPDQICITEPAARSRKVLGRKGRLHVGKARAPASQPTQPTQPTGDTYF